MSHRLTALLAAGGMALIATPFAVAAGEGGTLKAGARNPSTDESKALTRETEIIANNATYGTRQSNKSDNGGGAIYGCRSLEGGTPAKREPCVRANNLSRGLAFEFESDGGVVGTITAEGGESAKPFTTNATGVATGLNADRVDGKNAEDVTKDAVAAAQATLPFAQVNGAGQLGAKRGATTAAASGVGVYTVDFDRKVDDCAQQATVQGTDARFATVEQTDDDTVTVRTFDDAGAPVVSSFHLSLTC